MGNKAGGNKTEQRSIAVGLHKGFIVTEVKKTDKQAKQVRQNRKKGRLGKRVRLVRQLVAEVCGLSSYEKRVMELLKTGGIKESKKALKISKKALGTHQRAKAKREALLEAIRQQKKKNA